MSELVDRTNGQSVAKSKNNINNNSSRISGVVKFYSVQKCFGFIKRDDTKEYVFVHSKSISGKNIRRVTRSLAKGEHVEFDVVMSDRSPEAINVTGLNDGPVLGSEYALITMQWHQYDAYKQQLLQSDGISPRERSPRARRFFHRRGGNYSNRNGNNASGMRNDRGDGDRRRHRRPAPSAVNATAATNKGEREQSNENPENKEKSRRRFNRNRNRNRKPNKSADDEQNKMSDEKTGILTASNLTTLLSELTMGANPLNTANSTSSESLDFEKINCEDTNMCCTSRLAASFNKGN